MCSMNDEPTGWSSDNTTTTTRPRTYVLTGDRPQASVALAVIGTMLTEFEEEGRTGSRWNFSMIERWVIPTLLEARDRIAEAEKAAR